MIINNKDLKYNGQYSELLHTLAILMIFFKHSVLLTTTLMYFYKILLEPGADELLYFLIALVNSSFEKESYINNSFDGILSKMFMLI